MLAASLLLAPAARAQQDIPLPEHPRPDFQRPAWVNLNGKWQFRFDKGNEGLAQAWEKGEAAFPLAITVPFPWGSKLSGRSRHRADRMVRAHDRGASGLAGAARLPGRRRLRLAHHRVARREEAGRAPGRLHAVRVRAHAARASGHVPAPDPPRGRRGARVQARRQAGLRQRARHLADAVPGGARKGGAGRAPLHAGPGRAQGDGQPPTCSRPRPRT